jgi:hypothetical protein
MLKNIAKKLALIIPSVRDYVKHSRAMHHTIQSQQTNIDNLLGLISKSRSPSLFNSQADFQTERLLAHPAITPLPNVKLGSISAADKENRIQVADRLLRAYHISLEDEKASPLKREGDDLWTDLIRKELPELMQIIEGKNPEHLARYLMKFGSSFVWFGGITTCVDGYNKNLDLQQVALTYLDKLVCLGEYLGVLRYENPENGPWGENLHSNINSLIEEIENDVGIDIAPPMGIIHTDGIETNNGLFHYRHINALYSATRLWKLNAGAEPVCEFGGGLGMTAMYAKRLGLQDYTILDLPITCLLAGHYLIHAIGEGNVSLYGEDINRNQVKIFPYWECLKIPDKSIGITINQDSLPEIADNLVYEYLRQIKRTTRNFFLSINHECAYPRTVSRFVKHSGGFDPIYRSKCWVREGYVEELFAVSGLPSKTTR